MVQQWIISTNTKKEDRKESGVYGGRKSENQNMSKINKLKQSKKFSANKWIKNARLLTYKQFMEI